MRYRVVLVWLLLALMPVRGWATLAMQLPPSAAHTATEMQLAQAPCHDISATLASADTSADVANSAVGTGSHAGCSMCDLCHSAAACNAWRAPSVALNRVARVHPLADAATGRALVGRLERPPRILLG